MSFEKFIEICQRFESDTQGWFDEDYGDRLDDLVVEFAEEIGFPDHLDSHVLDYAICQPSRREEVWNKIEHLLPTY